MESYIVFSSKSNNNYLLNRETNNIVFLPPQLVESIKDNKSKDEYYNRKKKWMMKYGLLKEAYQVDFTSLHADNIEFCIDNLEQIVFEVTDACNLKCKYCGYGEMYNDYDARHDSYMNFQVAKNCLDYLFNRWKNNNKNRRTVYISFYGGEPLMNMNLIKQIVEYVKDNIPFNIEYIFSITTNAVYLRKYMNYLVCNNFMILISLDGDKYNNSYRVFDNSSKIESFDIVLDNVLNLKDNYPDYFEKNINFNAVLHDRNSVSDTLNFIYDKFGKVARIGELNPKGIAADRLNEYNNMKKNMQESVDLMENSTLKSDFFMSIPKKRLLFEFINNYTGNIYSSYNDLFNSKKYRMRRHTGTCVPFEKKLFLTVNGKILPCTTISQKYSLGYILDSEIQIDSQELSSMYNRWLDKLKMKCQYCYNNDSCKVCLFNMEQNENNDFVCSDFMNKYDFQKYLSYLYDILDENISDYYKIIEKTLIQ